MIGEGRTGDRYRSSRSCATCPPGPLRKGPTGIEPARIVAGQPGGDKGPVSSEGDTARIDARRIYYKTLNEQIREQIEAGAHTVILDNVNGQRYIGAGLTGDGRHHRGERRARATTWPRSWTAPP